MKCFAFSNTLKVNIECKYHILHMNVCVCILRTHRKIFDMAKYLLKLFLHSQALNVTFVLVQEHNFWLYAISSSFFMPQSFASKNVTLLVDRSLCRSSIVYIFILFISFQFDMLCTSTILITNEVCLAKY